MAVEAAMAETLSEKEQLVRWQRIILAMMVVGYAGYYLCRVNLSIATPLLIKAFGSQGMDKARIGAIASFGTLCYACGKFASGSLSDLLGGRKLFLTGMGGGRYDALVRACLTDHTQRIVDNSAESAFEYGKCTLRI